MSQSTLTHQATPAVSSVRAPAAPLRRTSPDARARRADLTDDLLLRAASEADAQERRRLLDEVVVLNMPVATSIASRFRSRGIAWDDLEQVAHLALVKSAQGYVPAEDRTFLAYCVPTIRGEIKRYFRDHGWMVRPPRRIQELQARISSSQAELSNRLGRSPRPSEVAAHLGVPVEDVTEALATDGCFTPASLDRPVGPEGDAVLGDLLSGPDDDQEAAEARMALGPAVRALGERDRRILMLRFFRGWTQQEIAEDIGVTQMQVSRLLSRILRDLRKALDD